MKQKDISLIVAVVVIGALLAVFVSRLLFSPANHQQQEVVVQPISSEFSKPDSRYFNANGSFDPTQIIRIGQNANQNPFNGTTSQ